MLAAYCDGCMDEIISPDREVMVSWVAAHFDHYRMWKCGLAPVLSVDSGALQR